MRYHNTIYANIEHMSNQRSTIFSNTNDNLYPRILGSMHICKKVTFIYSAMLHIKQKPIKSKLCNNLCYNRSSYRDP